MSKSKTYTVKATVTSMPDQIIGKYKVVLEGSGFTGTATEYSLGSAFEKAYENLMLQVSEAIFKDQ